MPKECSLLSGGVTVLSGDRSQDGGASCFLEKGDVCFEMVIAFGDSFFAWDFFFLLKTAKPAGKLWM